MGLRRFSRRASVAVLLAAVAANAACGAPRAEVRGDGRPNIIFIFSDDHALRTIGAYGSGLNQTPAIDRIANEGIVFTRSYCTNSICCPSRASILTGKHSHKNGVRDNADVWDGSQFVFTRSLKEAGYATALVGKWHMMKGDEGDPGDAFDYWNILSGSGGQGDYFNPEFLGQNGETTRVEGYSTDVITDQGLEWVDSVRDGGKPFLLMCQFKAPHIHRIPPPRHMDKYDGVEIAEPATMFDDYRGRSPYAAKTFMEFKSMGENILNIVPPAEDEEFAADLDKYPELARMTAEQRRAYHEAYDPDNDEYRRRRAAGELEDGSEALERYKYQRFVKDYLRCVAAIDDNVGRILNYLDEHRLAENTVVIYSSDQGFFTGEHGWNDKRWMYEESYSMPLVLRWPAVVAPGQKCEALVQNIDYAPTFLEMAGVEAPKDVDGVSLMPLLLGETPADWRKSLYYHYYEDGSYNLPRFEGVSTKRYKLINYYWPEQAWELFDLERDPAEMQSVYDDPAYAGTLAEMREELGRLRAKYELPPLERGERTGREP